MEWLEQVQNEELRGNEHLAKFKDVDSLAESYVNLERLRGRSLTVPGPDAPEESRAEFREKLQKLDPNLTVKPDGEEFWKWAGTPESVEAYANPEGVDLDDQVTEKTRELAAAANLTVDQYKNMAQYIHSERTAAQEAMQAAEQEKDQKFTSILGAAEKDAVRAAEALVREFSHQDLPVEQLPKEMILTLANIAKKFRQDPQAFNQPNDPTPILTREEASMQANEILGKLTSGEVARGSEEYKALSRKRMRLMEQAAA